MTASVAGQAQVRNATYLKQVGTPKGQALRPKMGPESLVERPNLVQRRSARGLRPRIDPARKNL